MMAGVGASVRLVDGLDYKPSAAKFEDILRPPRRGPLDRRHATFSGPQQGIERPGIPTFYVESPAFMATNTDLEFHDIVHECTSHMARPALMAMTVAIDSDRPKRVCKRRLA
jgi:hypothetical protein